LKRRSFSSKRQLALWILSLIVAVSMICSFVVMLRPTVPAPQPEPTATQVVARPATPTPAGTPTQRASTASPPTRQPALAPTTLITPTVTASPTGEKPPTESALSETIEFTFVACGDERGGKGG